MQVLAWAQTASFSIDIIPMVLQKNLLLLLWVLVEIANSLLSSQA